MQSNMLEEARRPARSRRAAMGDALRKALDMRFVRAGEYVQSTLHCETGTNREAAKVTYCARDMGRAALSQVRFQPGSHSRRTV